MRFFAHAVGSIAWRSGERSRLAINGRGPSKGMARAMIDGARFGSNDQAMSYARERVIDAFDAHNQICRITHVIDGTHTDGSSHYRNCADDYGFVGIPEQTRIAIVRHVAEAIGASVILYGAREGEPYGDFLIIYGGDGHKNHMHLQWKPQRAMNR